MVERIFDTIGQAHDWVVGHLIREDNQLLTEDGAATLESEFPVTIIVKTPFKEPMISPAYLFSKQKATEYVKQFTQLTPPNEDARKNFAYTYYNRLADYPGFIAGQPGHWCGDGSGGGDNQIQESIVDRLVKDPTSRRAIAITLVPGIDLQSHDPPCMQFIHCMIRNQQLNLVAYFRSNDMMSAWGANAYGLAHLQRQILDAINQKANQAYRQGWLMTTSGSAHLYENDGMQLKAFRRHLNI